MIGFLKVTKVDLCTRGKFVTITFHAKRIFKYMVKKLLSVFENANIGQDQVQELLWQRSDWLKLVALPWFWLLFLVFDSFLLDDLQGYYGSYQMLWVWLLDKLAGEKADVNLMFHFGKSWIIYQSTGSTFIDLNCSRNHQASLWEVKNAKFEYPHDLMVLLLLVRYEYLSLVGFTCEHLSHVWMIDTWSIIFDEEHID